MSIGRNIELSPLNLHAAGIELKKLCALKTDENCCIKDNIYAAGDITQHPSLVNIAEMEARYAVKHMFGKNRWPLSYENMSTVMFFNHLRGD